MDDLELIEKIKIGDSEAFNIKTEEALRKLKPALQKHFSDLKKEDFDDALQLALVKVWKKCAQFKGTSAFSTWFFIVIKNELYTNLSKRKKISDKEINISNIGFHPKCSNDEEGNSLLDFFALKNIDERLEQTSLSILDKREEIEGYRELIKNVLERLNPEHSQILMLALEEKKSYKEIASDLKLPLGTVMSRIYQARLRAQDLIKKYAATHDIQLSCLGKI